MDIDDVYAALERLDNVEIGSGINREKKSIKFNIGDQSYIVFLLGKEDDNEKIKILKAIKLKESESVKLSFGRKIENKINLTSDSTCKVVYATSPDKEHGIFVIQNIYSDKLNALKSKESDELRSDLLLLILGLLLDIERCTQEIMVELIALKGMHSNNANEGNQNGKEK